MTDKKNKSASYSSLKGFHRAVPIIMIATAVFMAFCFILKDMGLFGNAISGLFLGLFSYGAYALPLLLCLHAVFYPSDLQEKRIVSRVIFSLITVTAIASLSYAITYWNDDLAFNLGAFYTNGTKGIGGGFIGSIVGFCLIHMFSNVGLVIITVAVFAIYISYFFAKGQSKALTVLRMILKVIIVLLEMLIEGILSLFGKVKKAKKDKQKRVTEQKNIELTEDEFFGVDNGMQRLKIPELGIKETRTKESIEGNPTLQEKVFHKSVVSPEEAEEMEEMEMRERAAELFAQEQAARAAREHDSPIPKRRIVNVNYGDLDTEVGKSQQKQDIIIEEVPEEDTTPVPDPIPTPSFSVDDSADSIFTKDFDPFSMVMSEELASKPSSRSLLDEKPVSRPVTVKEDISEITEEDIEKMKRIEEFERRKNSLLHNIKAVPVENDGEFTGTRKNIEFREYSAQRFDEIAEDETETSLKLEKSVELPKAEPARYTSIDEDDGFTSFNSVIDQSAFTAPETIYFHEEPAQTVYERKNPFTVYENGDEEVLSFETSAPVYEETRVHITEEPKFTVYEEEPAVPIYKVPEPEKNEESSDPVINETEDEIITEHEYSAPLEYRESALEEVSEASVESIPTHQEESAVDIEETHLQVEANLTAIEEVPVQQEEPTVPIYETHEPEYAQAPINETVSYNAEPIVPAYQQPAPGYNPAPVYQQPAPGYNPAPIYQQPAPGYNPAPVYQQPAPGYNPAPVYQQPAPGYNPAPVYQQPAPGYNPAPVYQQPAPGYNPAPVYQQPTPGYNPAPVYQQPAPEYNATPVSPVYEAPAPVYREEPTAPIYESHAPETFLSEEPSYENQSRAITDNGYISTSADQTQESDFVPEFKPYQPTSSVETETVEIEVTDTEPETVNTLQIERTLISDDSDTITFNFEETEEFEDELLVGDDEENEDEPQSYDDEAMTEEDGGFNTVEIPPEERNPVVQGYKDMFPALRDEEPEEEEDHSSDYQLVSPDEIVDSDGLDYDYEDDDDEPPFEASSSYSQERITPKAKPEPKKEEKKKPDYSNYKMPSIDLLGLDPMVDDDNSEITENTNILIDTLASFNVTASIKGVDRGPRITRYEVVPARGVKVQAITSLFNDITLNLAKEGVRMEAPIPGKSAVGFEIPNKAPKNVRLRELLECEEFAHAKSKTFVSIGKDVAGNPVFGDISKYPHALICGATGMGKSVCINSILVSMLYKARPDEVKFIMIDPKKVEFKIYSGIPHLLIPVITESKQAAGALMWAVEEMERRYELIEKNFVRNIEAYNEKVAFDPSLGEPLPKIVIVIDELADLMMQVRDPVEDLIMRIAQKARAAGIHLIIGTQRPSVQVITGAIKANIPSRISCKVTSQVDSRTIFDVGGAEKLLNRGDMLYWPVDRTAPLRVQGAFVSDSEVEAIMNFLKENGDGNQYDDEVMAEINKAAQKCGNNKKGGVSADDIVDDDQECGYYSDQQFLDAVDLAIRSKKISTSLLQRKLSIGYGKAAKYIDAMEEIGVVSEPKGQKPRDVLITMDEWHEKLARVDLD